MQKFKDITDMINKLESSKTDYMKLSDYERIVEDKGNFALFKDSNDMASYMAYAAQKDAEMYAKRIIDLEIACYKNNLDLLILDYVKHVVVDTLQKFEGRRCGTVTLKKIEGIINEELGDYHPYGDQVIYLKDKVYAIVGISHDAITVWGYRFNGVTNMNNLEMRGSSYKNYFINEDNRVSAIDIDDIHVCYHCDMIESVPAYIEEKERLYTEIIEVAEKYSALTSVYNKNLLPNLSSFNTTIRKPGLFSN